MNKKGKFKFEVLLILIVFSIISAFVLYTVATTDSDNCLYQQGEICVSYTFLILAVIFGIIQLILIYKTSPALFWIWLLIQFLMVFTSLGSVFKGIT